ncbi:hypothetical protein SERP0096 [Staphylococcus epidermidis RP62A]|uniref:Uncharacterized protein n=1 Tax=Staphylococcus epidermidis (strain ATCC 35984 / DSM 28319 / BCRC 17069 / CCUG 31568 / BM 3577 / RP62A) TaxID=176279 RepID=Q5HRU6_STAEQ|nr:hypothetical protein SERP0096 [Staphylococcus epidermidis RP62A]
MEKSKKIVDGTTSIQYNANIQIILIGNWRERLGD